MTVHLQYKGALIGGLKKQFVFQFQKRPGRFFKKNTVSFGSNLVILSLFFQKWHTKEKKNITIFSFAILLKNERFSKIEVYFNKL